MENKRSPSPSLWMARAMLSDADDLVTVTRQLDACLGECTAWHEQLVARLFAADAFASGDLSAKALSEQIERDPSFIEASASLRKPTVRRYFLERRNALQPSARPLATVERPHWTTTTELARWLGLSIDALWRLTLPTGWQRRTLPTQQHYRHHLVPKRSGGHRLIEAPEPYLAELQRRLLKGLIYRVPVHEAACAYRPGRSPLDHARAHVGHAAVLKMDLTDFFSSVRASRINAIFQTLGYSESVARALTSLCTTSTPERFLRDLNRAGAITWPQLQRLRDAHLPQGAPSSAALANLCAFGLDVRLAALADSMGAVYTRYADDLVVSGPPTLYDSRRRVEGMITSIVIEEGFEVNRRKTHWQRRSRRQTVAGAVVNSRVGMPRDEFDRLKAILHRCVIKGPDAENRQCIENWRDTLQGRLSWALALNPDKASKLVDLWRRIDWTR